jgi:hypothetical protein
MLARRTRDRGAKMEILTTYDHVPVLETVALKHVHDSSGTGYAIEQLVHRRGALSAHGPNARV